jgi:hypothetical protein
MTFVKGFLEKIRGGTKKGDISVEYTAISRKNLKSLPVCGIMDTVSTT